MLAPDRNPAYRLAALFYLFAAAKARPNLVFMPYASILAGLAEWFCHLWAESLGASLQGTSECRQHPATGPWEPPTNIPNCSFTWKDRPTS